MVIIKDFSFHIGLCLRGNTKQWPREERNSYHARGLHTSCIFLKGKDVPSERLGGYNKKILEEAWEITLIPGPNLSHVPYFAWTNLAVERNVAFPFSRGSRLLPSVCLELYKKKAFPFYVCLVFRGVSFKVNLSFWWDLQRLQLIINPSYSLNFLSKSFNFAAQGDMNYRSQSTLDNAKTNYSSITKQKLLMVNYSKDSTLSSNTYLILLLRGEPQLLVNCIATQHQDFLWFPSK